MDIENKPVNANKALDHLWKLTDSMIDFQNRFEQFKLVVGTEDHFYELMKIPHVSMLWDNLCALSAKSAEIANDTTSWKT